MNQVTSAEPATFVRLLEFERISGLLVSDPSGQVTITFTFANANARERFEVEVCERYGAMTVTPSVCLDY